MKANLMFRDQVNTLSSWFEHWSECERTVALYSICSRLGAPQARLLVRVLEHSLADCTELPRLEQEANDSAFVSSLSEEPKETAIHQLLQHLPLLCPGNKEAKDEYLRLIPQVLAESLQTGSFVEESRQLLSYSLIHPALSLDDRYSLNYWLHHSWFSGSNTSTLASNGTNSGVNGHSYQQQHSFVTQQQSRVGSPQLNSSAPGNGRFDNWKNYAVSSPVMNPDPTVRTQPSAQVADISVGPCHPSPETTHHFHHKTINGQSQFSALGMSSGQASFYIQQLSSGFGPVVNGAQQSPLSSQSQELLHARIRRSNSLTPPTCVAQGPLLDETPMHSKQRSMSLSSDHAPLSPQSSLASSGSGSEGQLDEPRNSFSEEGSGMKDVPVWLKGLRLHKYAHLFAHMTYEEMMNLTEDRLENVTKGARHKIILSIQKLKERQESLQKMEKEIIEGGSVRNAMSELKSMLNTPIKPSSQHQQSGDVDAESVSSGAVDSDAIQTVLEGDLVGQFTRVIGKICTQLLVTSHPEDESFSQFVGLVYKCLQHEAFTETQKKRLLSWKQQVQKIWHPLPPRRGSDVRHNRGRWNGGGQLGIVGVGGGGSGGGGYGDVGSLLCSGNGGLPNLSRRRVSGPFILQGNSCGSCHVQHQTGQQQQQQQQQHHHLSPKHFVLSPMQQIELVQMANSASMAGLFNKRGSLQDNKLHGCLARTKSAPVRPIHLSQFGKPVSEAGLNDPEINTRLESLCLSVTEHALGSLG